MSSKNSKFIVLLIFLFLIGVGFFLFFKDNSQIVKNNTEIEALQQTDENIKITPEIIEKHNDSKERSEKQLMAKVKELYNTPINFWGRVVNQDGNPIESAQVTFSTLNKIGGQGTKYNRTTDADGFFNITNISGAELLVKTSKEGFYSPYETAQRSFKYDSPEYGKHPLPTKSNPAIFTLKEKGVTEPLVKYTKGSKIPSSGASVGFDLKKGTVVTLEQADLIVSGYPNDKPTYQGKKNYPYPWGYQWGYKLEVTGGGLIEKEGENYAFIAPESGYQKTFEFDMPQSGKDENWKSSDERNFYVILSNGTYAEINFRCIPGGDRFMVVDGLYNPSGSRNLEYDKSKRIK